MYLSQIILPPQMQRTVWGIRIFLALAFISAGLCKLAGLPQMIQIFDSIGFGQWLRYMTGSVEVLGAILLLVPSTGLFGGLILTATMIGAIATHLALIGGNPAPAVVLGLLSAFVTWQLRPTIRDQASHHSPL